MKKILCIFLLLAAVVASIPVRAETRQYEVWEKSPEITTNATTDRVYIWKAMSNGLFEAHKLDALGSNYYLGVVHDERSDGGKYSKSEVDLLRYYVLLATEDDFIILDSAWLYNDYYQKNPLTLSNISNDIDMAFYEKKGSDKPFYVIHTGEYYTWSTDYTYYYENVIITDKGKICLMQDKQTAEVHLKLKDGVVHRTVAGYKVGTSNALRVQSMTFSGKTVSYTTVADIKETDFKADESYQPLDRTSQYLDEVSTYYTIPNVVDTYIRVTPIVNRVENGKIYYDCLTELVRRVNGVMEVIDTRLQILNSASLEKNSVWIVNDLDDAYYMAQEEQKPMLVVNNVIIDEQGKMHIVDFGGAASKYTQSKFITYNGRLAVVRNRDGTGGYFYHQDENNRYTYWQRINYVHLTESGATIESDIEVRIGKQEGMNGWFNTGGTFTAPSWEEVARTQDWFGRGKNNVFPDGRSMRGSWVNNKNDQEMYIQTYDSAGTILSTTRTGWLRTNYEDSIIYCYAVNNSKVVVALGRMENTDYYEFYRAGVLNETEDGEIGGFGGGGGTKNLTPPELSDTEPVQTSIDFNQTDLPIGFNLKDNIVEDTKLTPQLREQINAVRLNDIVILRKEGYVSGTQNAGTMLEDFSQYDYAMGNTGVYVYSNGQNFNWYCTEPERLAEGVYNQTYYIGDKAVYVTFKVVQPPANDGITTVVF